jgi:hypothetical protein
MTARACRQAIAADRILAVTVGGMAESEDGSEPHSSNTDGPNTSCSDAGIRRLAMCELRRD